jgi:hypothetical protein
MDILKRNVLIMDQMKQNNMLKSLVFVKNVNY